MQLHMGKLSYLQKLDLSFNQIKRLPDASCFSSLFSLKVLYLHDNVLASWEDLQNVRAAPALVHLTLHRNPVSQVPGIRA